MKVCGMIALLLLASFKLHAMNFQCTKNLGNNSYLITRVQAEDMVQVTINERDCRADGTCIETSHVITDNNTLCNHSMNVAESCSREEYGDIRSGYMLQLRCVGNVIMTVTTRENKIGRLACARGGQLINSWNFDSCVDLSLLKDLTSY